MPLSRPPKTIGLVLSGGGSRGAAHIGVLRALLENGIEPAVVAGASAGAVVGALYAAGHTPQRMVEFFTELHPASLGRMTLLKPGLLDSMKFEPLFRRYLPDDRFEALSHTLYVVATDLLSGQATVFDTGPLVLPLLASASVPMIYSPTIIDGRWYTDGGVVDNFPARLLADRCDAILGSYLSPIRGVQPKELDSSLKVVGRALDIGMFAQARERFAECDVVIIPEGLDAYGLFDSQHIPAIEAAGYEAAQKRMPELLRVAR